MSDPILERLFPKLGFIVIQRAGSGDLSLLTPAPRWFVDAARSAAGGGSATLGSTFPFLDDVRAEAERFWASGEDGVMLGEPFAVAGAAEEYLVRPRIVTVEGHKLLLLERLSGIADSRPVLQAAREARLEHERTMLRVNDVRGPIASIARLAGQLLEADLPAPARGLVQDVLRAADDAQGTVDRITDGA